MFGDDKEVAQRHAQLGKVGAVHSNTGSTVLHSPTFPCCGLSARKWNRRKNSSLHIPLQRVSSSCLIVEEEWVMQVSQY